MNKIYSKHLFEIRYKANPGFLDKRGEIVTSISSSYFDRWGVSSNRIEWRSKKEENILAFLSLRNLGLQTSYPISADQFKEKTKDFLRAAWGYFLTDKIIRIGIRSTYLIETQEFVKSFSKIRQKFLALSSADEARFGGSLIDLGFPLNFAVNDDFFNVSIGPMNKEQAKGEFEIDEKLLPESVVFLDVDYFRNEVSPHITQKNVFGLVDLGIKKAEEIKDLLYDWVVV